MLQGSVSVSPAVSKLVVNDARGLKTYLADVVTGAAIIFLSKKEEQLSLRWRGGSRHRRESWSSNICEGRTASQKQCNCDEEKLDNTSERHGHYFCCKLIVYMERVESAEVFEE